MTENAKELGRIAGTVEGMGKQLTRMEDKLDAMPGKYELHSSNDPVVRQSRFRWTERTVGGIVIGGIAAGVKFFIGK